MTCDFQWQRISWLPFIILLSDGFRGSEREFRLFLDGLLLEGSGSFSVGRVSGRFEFGEHGQTRWVERCVTLLVLSLKIAALLRGSDNFSYKSSSTSSNIDFNTFLDLLNLSWTNSWKFIYLCRLSKWLSTKLLHFGNIVAILKDIWFRWILWSSNF